MNASAVSPSDAYTTVGLLLTLAGLLATFFSVQLSEWLMRLWALTAKWKAYAKDAAEESKAARRECRAELPGSFNFVPLVITLAVGTFTVFIIASSYFVLALVDDSPLKSILQSALGAFSICYGLLTAIFLVSGYALGFRLKKQMQ